MKITNNIDFLEKNLKFNAKREYEKTLNSISKYLGFNLDEIFSCTDYAYPFGGAVRDSIANMSIHDVDIMCLPDSEKKCEEVLVKHGYVLISSLSGKDILSMYTDLQYITEPKTYMNSEMKIVQLIRPRYISTKICPITDGKTAFMNILNNVDLSTCGVYITKSDLHQSISDAIEHCKRRIFTVNKNAKMYNAKRIHQRIQKLVDRGWYEVQLISQPTNIPTSLSQEFLDSFNL